MITPLYLPSCTDSNVTLFTGYVVYDLLHFYLHHGSPKEGSHFYYMKRYHNWHHFTHYDTGFGITSSFWDRIFGTEIVLRKLSRALKWWQWTSSPEQGNVQNGGYHIQPHKRTIFHTINLHINITCTEVTERHTIDQPSIQLPQTVMLSFQLSSNSVHTTNSSDSNLASLHTVNWLT